MNIVLYLVFGVLSFAINFGIYFLLSVNGLFNYFINTLIACLLTSIVNLIICRKCILGSKIDNDKEKVNELKFFYVCLAAIIVMDVALMYVAVDMAKFNDMHIKILCSFLVVICTYVASMCYGIYLRFKSVILYLVFGVLTTIINIATYYLLSINGLFNTVINTSIAWVVGVVFAYATNKKWVFESKTEGFEEGFKELMSFVGCRVATGVMDVVIMFIFVDLLHFNDMIIKVVSNVLVVILNYVGSKLLVFRNKSSDNQEDNAVSNEINIDVKTVSNEINVDIKE